MRSRTISPAWVATGWSVSRSVVDSLARDLAATLALNSDLPEGTSPLSVWPSADRTAVLERVDTRAREIRPGQALRNVAKGSLALITNILFCIGFVSARTLRFGWLCLAWVYAALAEGFAEGFRASGRG